MVRTLIAVVGVGYILYSLSWSDRVALPAGFELTSEVTGGLDGASYVVWEESEDAYLVGPANGGVDKPTVREWILKTEFKPGRDNPQFQPSFITILTQSNVPLLLTGGCLLIPIIALASLRWWVLMRARGIDVSLSSVCRLTLVGYFFNLCMPGTTGGDVLKAFYIAKGTSMRGDAVISIGIDRLCGLVGLVLLVGLIGLFSWHDPLLQTITLAMWGGLLAASVLAGFYTSVTIRKRLNLGHKLRLLPCVSAMRKVDEWIRVYRQHLGTIVCAIALSLPIHLGFASAMMLSGYALGIDQPALYLLSTIPVVLILWSLPVSGPLGLGPLDIVAVHLIVGSSLTSEQQALMMFVTFRLYLVAAGLLGAAALIGLQQQYRRSSSSIEPSMQ